MVKKVAILAGVVIVLVSGGLVWYLINQSDQLSEFESALNRADELAEGGDVQGALRVLDEEAAKEKDEAKKSSLYARQGSLLAISGDTSGAASAAEKASLVKPIPEAPSLDNKEAFYEYVSSIYTDIAGLESFLKGGQYPEEASDLDDTHKRAIALGSLAQLYELVGDTQKALKYYKEALAFLEDNPEVEDFGERQLYEDRIEKIEG